MFPFANNMIGGDQDAIYVGGYFFGTGVVGTSPPLASLGAVPGDVAVFAHRFFAPKGGSGEPWTPTGEDLYLRAVYKRLNAADVSAGITASEGSALVIYRGPIVSCALVARAEVSSPAGFVKHRAHVGLIGMAPNRPDTIYDAVAGVSPDFIRRGYALDTVTIAAFDRLSPPNATYVDQTLIRPSSDTVSILELRSE